MMAMAERGFDQASMEGALTKNWATARSFPGEEPDARCLHRRRMEGLRRLA